TRGSEYEHDRDHWREHAGSLNERLEMALAAAAAAEAQREVWERATGEARGAAEQLETRLRGELEQLALDRDHRRTRGSEYEHARDHWRGHAGSLNERLEMALAAAAAAEAQREVWERATEEARGAAEQLETRLRGELEQLALDRDNWRRGAGEYEQ